MNILMIEPDKVLADIYIQALDAADHQVTWTTSAEDAIQHVDTRKPDVVVLELQLAGHNGVEFLYEFRSYPEWQNVPVIILSHVSEVVLTPVLQSQLGVAAYLYKSRTKLTNLLRTLDRLATAV